MATSDTGVDEGKFLTSRKNVVGMGLAAATIAAHVAVGLGFLWPVVALSAWGAGVALTPNEKPKELPPAPEKPTPLKLEESLKNTLRELARAKPPEPVLTQAREMESNLRFDLAEWNSLERSPKHQMTVYNIIEIYLPEVISTYLAAPNFRSDEAVASMTDSLSTLTQASGRIKQGILDHNLRAMDSQARTLRENFGNLPGLDGA